MKRFRIEGTGRGGRRERGGEGEERDAFANEPEQCSSTAKHAKHAENGPLTTDHGLLITDHRPWSRSPVVPWSGSAVSASLAVRYLGSVAVQERGPETRSSERLCGAVRRPEETVALEDGCDGLALLLGDWTERDGGKAVADPDGRARGLEGR